MTYHAQLSQANDRPGLIVMGSLFCATSISVVGLRFYARRLTRLAYGTDDWLALAALILVLALNGIFIGGTVQGAITGHSVVVHDWPLTSDLEHLVEKYKYAFQITEKVAFGLIKLSILFLWKRIFGHIRAFRIACWTVIGIVIAWSISFFFATIFQCGLHWSWNWAPITLFLTQCTNTLNMLTVFTATDLLTDFAIIAMPIPMIWGLHMPNRKKVGVSAIFALGFFTVGAGIARMYIYLVTSYDKEDNPDFIADFTLFILWSEIEANIAMIVCCMPTFVPVISRFHDGLVHIFKSAIGSHRHLLSDTENQVDDGASGSTAQTRSTGKHGDAWCSMSDESKHSADTRAFQVPMTDDVEKQLKDSKGIVVHTEISRRVDETASD